MELFQVNERLARSSQSKNASHDSPLGDLPEKMASGEERMIWLELEYEIEKSLEEEIKDGIQRRALQLHKLYQQTAGGIRKSNSAPEISRTKSKSSSKGFQRRHGFEW